MCGLLYTIQNTSRLPSLLIELIHIIIAMFPSTVFRKILEFRKIIVSVLENLSGLRIFFVLSHYANFSTWFNILLAFRLNCNLIHIIFFSLGLFFGNFECFDFKDLVCEVKFWPRLALCQLWNMTQRQHTSTFWMTLIINLYTYNEQIICIPNGIQNLHFVFHLHGIQKVYNHKSSTLGWIGSKSIEIREKKYTVLMKEWHKNIFREASSGRS